MSRRLSRMGGLAACLALALILSARPVFAQGIDYTAAEQMFGEPVTASVTGKPQRVSEVPANMTIVTADEIRRSGSHSVPEVLRFVAGIDVRTYGQQDSAVAIRGYNTAFNPRVLVLLDGRQVYDDAYGLVIWPLIPVTMTEIRQIEIVKGPAAALYGFNAVSGVINIVTYDPLRDRVNGGFVQGGTQDTAYGEAVATLRTSDRAGVRVSVKGFRGREFGYTDGVQTSMEHLAPRNGAINADGRLRVNDDWEWDLSASISSAQYDEYNDTGFYNPGSFHANSLRSRLTGDTRFGLLEFDVYRNESRADRTSELFDLAWRQDVTVVRVSDLVKLGSDHVVRVAGEFRDNSISSLVDFNGRLGYTIVAGSAMWAWQVLPSLSLTNAVRIDHLSLGHRGSQFFVPGMDQGIYRNVELTEVSYNSGAVLKLSEEDTVRFSIARALQLPSLFDFGVGTGNGYNFVLAGNAGLRPAAVTNLELDYDRALPSLGATVRLAAFAQRTDTTIGSPFGSGIDFSSGLPTLTARNFGSSHEIGGEIEIKGESAGIRWHASYALASVHDDSPQDVLAGAPSVSFQRQTPVHSVVLGAGKTWGKFELDGQVRWQSHYQDFTTDPITLTTSSVTIPNYVTMNVHGAYRMTESLTLSLTGEQLLQHRLMQTGGLRTERRLLAGLRAHF